MIQVEQKYRLMIRRTLAAKVTMTVCDLILESHLRLLGTLVNFQFYSLNEDWVSIYLASEVKKLSGPVFNPILDQNFSLIPILNFRDMDSLLSNTLHRAGSSTAMVIRPSYVQTISESQFKGNSC